MPSWTSCHGPCLCHVHLQNSLEIWLIWSTLLFFLDFKSILHVFLTIRSILEWVLTYVNSYTMQNSSLLLISDLQVIADLPLALHEIEHPTITSKEADMQMLRVSESVLPTLDLGGLVGMMRHMHRASKRLIEELRVQGLQMCSGSCPWDCLADHAMRLLQASWWRVVHNISKSWPSRRRWQSAHIPPILTKAPEDGWDHPQWQLR